MHLLYRELSTYWQVRHAATAMSEIGVLFVKHLRNNLSARTSQNRHRLTFIPTGYFMLPDTWVPASGYHEAFEIELNKLPRIK
jgi:hypothetical protein